MYYLLGIESVQYLNFRLAIQTKVKLLPLIKNTPTFFLLLTKIGHIVEIFDKVVHNFGKSDDDMIY